MVERYGDHQRKFDGLGRWPFRLFIKSLPIMPQISLLLLTYSLSRYVWSTNASVARVFISFTVLAILFYIEVVIVVGRLGNFCELISAQPHLAYLHRLEEHLTGALFGIPPGVRHHSISIILGGFAVPHHV